MIKNLKLALIVATNLAGIFFFTWPLFINSEFPLMRDLSDATWVSLLLTLIAVLILALDISTRLLDSKTVAIVAVLVSLIAALRLLGAGAVGLEPMWFLLIISARALGAELGYVIAVVAMFVSGLITGGVGPWLPFQILAASWIALGVRIIPRSFKANSEIFSLSVYGFFAALLYGALMDLQLWPWILGTDTQLSYQPGAAITENLARFTTFHFATAMSWDLPRAILTATLIALTGRSILFALHRANSRMTAIADWRTASGRGKEQKVV